MDSSSRSSRLVGRPLHGLGCRTARDEEPPVRDLVAAGSGRGVTRSRRGPVTSWLDAVTGEKARESRRGGYTHGMPDMTTIKVPRTLRNRISRDASRRGVTASALIGELLDRHEREQRLAAVGEAYAAGAPDVTDDADVEAWETTVADGWVG